MRETDTGLATVAQICVDSIVVVGLENRTVAKDDASRNRADARADPDIRPNTPYKAGADLVIFLG